MKRILPYTLIILAVFSCKSVPRKSLHTMDISEADSLSVKTAHDTSLAKPHEMEQDSLALPEEAVSPMVTDSVLYTALVNSLCSGDTTGLWPVKGLPVPKAGAILPFKRVVAYYGNMYSKDMGVLGEYAPEALWNKLRKEVKAWEEADSLTPVQPAIHYIATTAQGRAGSDGKFRLRMPPSQIDSALSIAKMGDAILFLDIQPGHSTVQDEVPVIEEYLKMPSVHLAIDPEFYMKGNSVPGRRMGTMSAEEVNWCIDYLSDLVKTYDLPPKILVIHRFTQPMLTDSDKIRPTPEVQVVIDMDGWGAIHLKQNTWHNFIYPYPVQFTGFKLFYKNDLKGAPHRLMTPQEILSLTPKPIYIQYQ